MAGFTIRPGDAADATEARRIVDAAYTRYIERIGKRPAPMLDDLAARIRRDELWVLEQGHAIHGIIVLLAEPDHLLLDNVAVDPTSHGKGVGGALIRFAEAEARRRGYDEIRLYTNAKMHENLAMYPRLGYEETGRAEQAGFQRVFFRKTLA
jgi:ribosomal protein S18 acetylase RimI-like enzyme